MNTGVKVALVGAAAGAGYVGYDYLATRGQPGASGESLVGRAVDTVRNALPTALGGPTGRLVATPYPVLNMIPREVREGTSSNRSLFGVQELATEICGQGSAPIVAGLASCESQGGSLDLRCYNCNLFGLHISPAQIAAGRPYFISRGEQFIDFLTGAPSQVEGFRACMRYFMQWMNDHAPRAIDAMRSGQFETFELNWAGPWGASSYQSDIASGRVPNSRIRNRYDRLVANHMAG